MNMAAFVGYVLFMAFSPGPNNIMAMTNSARVGLKRAAVFCVGVVIGFTALGILSAVFTSALFELTPLAAPVMKWVGALFILFLAVVIYLDRPHKEGKNPYLKPDGLVTGIVMQFINIKGILCCLTSMSSFVLPYTRSVPLIAAAIAFMSLSTLVSTLCWALSGYLFQRVFEKYRKRANIVMALLLVYCAVMSVL